MADFDVVVRGGYRDVGGLVLDCAAHDYVAEDGRVARWRNRAPQLPLGTGRARFGDPQLYAPADVTRRPRVGADGAVKFVRAEQTILLVPSDGGDGAATRAWAFAFDLVAGSSTANDQAVLGFADAGAFGIYRRQAGSMVVKTSSSSSGAPHDLALSGRGSIISFRRQPLTEFDWHVNGATVVAGGVCSAVTVPANAALAASVGAAGGSDYLDGSLYALRAWRKPLAPMERDLVAADLRADGVSNAATTRCAVSSAAWRDGTGSPHLRQVDRLRPLPGVPHRFKLARRPGGAAARVQFGCEQAGLTLEDALLGPDLYAVSLVERPANATVSSDGGWSSVIELTFTQAGHYAIMFSRPNHGGRLVHLDVA